MNTIDLYEQTTQRHAALLAYRGSHYHGSQYQVQGAIVRPTVQLAVETALKQLGIHTRVKLASRTDAGVHARGQVMHFDTASDALVNIADLKLALNAQLPDDIAVQDAVLNVGHEFHCRQQPKWRWYRYHIINSSARPVFDNDTALWVKDPLDVDAMQCAAQQWMGRQNFKSMKCLDTPVLDDWCCVAYSNVSFSGNSIYFDVVANRFLYKMVRNLAGLLVAVGQAPHQLPPDRIPEILNRRDVVFSQSLASTAKAHGLTLMAIDYPEPYRFFSNNPEVRQLTQLMMEFSQYENVFSETGRHHPHLVGD